MNTLCYPIFAGTLVENPGVVPKANACDPSAGEYMRTALDTLKQFIDKRCINIEKCNDIKDNYTEVILRFYEGDVPMMICSNNTSL